MHRFAVMEEQWRWADLFLATVVSHCPAMQQNRHVCGVSLCHSLAQSSIRTRSPQIAACALHLAHYVYTHPHPTHLSPVRQITLSTSNLVILLQCSYHLKDFLGSLMIFTIVTLFPWFIVSQFISNRFLGTKGESNNLSFFFVLHTLPKLTRSVVVVLEEVWLKDSLDLLTFAETVLSHFCRPQRGYPKMTVRLNLRRLALLAITYLLLAISCWEARLPTAIYAM